MNPLRKKTESSKETPEMGMSLQKRSIIQGEIDPVKEAALQAKIISKKKVLFTDIDDEITSIYDKLRKYKMKNIYIVIPKRAILFQSVINLRILKRKIEDLKKNVFIITNDTNGMQLASRAGFTVFDKLEGSEHPSLVSGKLTDDYMKISPLEASINTFEDDTPTRLKSKKLSIAELIRRTKKTEETSSNPLTQRIKDNQQKKKKEKNRYVLVSPNRQALTILITVSVLILFLIVYIAIPGATVKITPKSDTVTVSSNVTLAEATSNRNYLDTHPANVIASFPAEVTMVKKMTYSTTGNKFEGKNATGTLTISNTSGKEWPLIEQTRFQTDDGLVYRIQNSITVPSGSLSGPGTVDAFVVADELDANGQIIGERGNIEPAKFFLPGLSEDNRQKIYAENKSKFAGGETITHKMVSAEDLTAAKGKMETELMNAVEEELKMQVLKMNQENNMELTLLTGNGAFYTGTPTISVPDNIEGQIVESFEVTGQMYVKGISYNYNELLNILRAKLKLSKNPEKVLTKIDTESVTIRLVPIEEGDDPTRQKITATIKGIEQYEISPDKEGGKRIIENIKEHILGKSVDEAELYIQQLPSINSVSIDIWPAWSPNIPSVPDNVKIQIVESL
ncbi:hypothetical protein C0416_05130 [bacterium]|nr:hypothetical protein [bacterium]